jgi:preprotein translocase subunit SecD
MRWLAGVLAALVVAGTAMAQEARDVLVLELNADALRTEVMRIAAREASVAKFGPHPEEVHLMEVGPDGTMQRRTVKAADLPADHPALLHRPSRSVKIVGDTLEVGSAGDPERAIEALGRLLPGFEITLRIDAKAVATLTPDGFMRRMNSAVEVSREVLVRRLEAAGVSGATVERDGARLKVSAPAGVVTDDIIELLQARGAVSFHVVNETRNPADFDAPGVAQGGFRTLPNVSRDGELQVIAVQPIISPGEVAEASAGFDDYGRANIAFTLTPGGRAKFAAATRQMIGHAFAIVLDDTIISAPVVQSEINGGEGQITGLFSTEEARMLAASMMGATLPVRLELVERRVEPAQ